MLDNFCTKAKISTCHWQINCIIKPIEQYAQAHGNSVSHSKRFFKMNTFFIADIKCGMIMCDLVKNLEQTFKNFHARKTRFDFFFFFVFGKVYHLLKSHQ